jgi:hypothetical protein
MAKRLRDVCTHRKANRSALRPPVSEVTLPISIHAIIRRIEFVDDDWR